MFGTGFLFLPIPYGFIPYLYYVAYAIYVQVGVWGQLYPQSEWVDVLTMGYTVKVRDCGSVVDRKNSIDPRLGFFCSTRWGV